MCIYGTFKLIYTFVQSQISYNDFAQNKSFGKILSVCVCGVCGVHNTYNAKNNKKIPAKIKTITTTCKIERVQKETNYFDSYTYCTTCAIHTKPITKQKIHFIFGKFNYMLTNLTS